MSAETNVTGLEYWAEAASGGSIAPEAVARLLAHPRAGEAMRRSVDGGLAYFDADPKTNTYFQDLGSFGLGIIALQLDATGGITHRRLKQLSQSSTMLSGGRASAILAMLRLKGFAVREASGGQVRYRPAPPLRRFFIERLRVELDAIALVEPAIAPTLAHWDALFDAVIADLGQAMIHAGQNTQQDMEMLTRIGMRRCGMLLFYQLMQAADGGAAFPTIGSFAISVSATARRFSLSRSHILRTLRLIADEGLIARDDKQGGGHFLPPAGDIFPRYWAYGQIGVLASCHRVMAAV